MRPERFVFLFLMGALLLGIPALNAAERIPGLATIPNTLPAARRDRLALRRTALERQLSELRAATAAFNAKETQTDRETHAIESLIAAYTQAATAFNADIAVEAEGARVIARMNASAGRLGWTTEKQRSVAAALARLDFDGDPNVSAAQIRQAWQDILARRPDETLAREAGLGQGPGLPGAGQQTTFEDCAVFALANAAGLPYGTAAARATALIRDGDWRTAADRADPKRVIEQQGLLGGEVVMIAEAFGQAEVVPGADFARVLGDGRTILLNVVPPGGRGGHEVVLTRAFHHGSETWFELMDSNQGPIRRLYLSQRELGIIQQENGVAFRPEPGTTPQLLR